MSRISTIGTSKYQLSSINEQAGRTSKASALTKSSDSSKVTLSQDARVIANFASKGISVSLREVSKQVTSQNENNASENYIDTKVYEGSISRDDLDKLLNRLGITNEDKEKIKSGLDVNKDGSISHSELLRAISGTLDNDSGFSQVLLRVMDRKGDADGTVSSTEFAKFTTLLDDAEK